MDGKVFSKETKDLIVKVADDVVKLPALIEPFDSMAFSILVNFIDKQGDKVIPDKFDGLINVTVALALNKQYEEAAAEAGSALDALIDIPYLDDEVEKLLFVDGAKFLVRLLQNWIEKKKVTP